MHGQSFPTSQNSDPIEALRTKNEGNSGTVGTTGLCHCHGRCGSVSGSSWTPLARMADGPASEIEPRVVKFSPTVSRRLVQMPAGFLLISKSDFGADTRPSLPDGGQRVAAERPPPWVKSARLPRPRILCARLADAQEPPWSIILLPAIYVTTACQYLP